MSSGQRSGRCAFSGQKNSHQHIMSETFSKENIVAVADVCHSHNVLLTAESAGKPTRASYPVNANEAFIPLILIRAAERPDR